LFLCRENQYGHSGIDETAEFTMFTRQQLLGGFENG